jgi:hypothetical protein
MGNVLGARQLSHICAACLAYAQRIVRVLL